MSLSFVGFIDAGVVWKVIPMLLGFDKTVEVSNDESHREVYCQQSSNMHAMQAAECLGRLGKYVYIHI